MCLIALQKKTKTHKKHPNNYSYAQTKEKFHSTKHPNTIYIDDAVDTTMKELESSLVPTIYIYLQINIKKLLKQKKSISMKENTYEKLIEAEYQPNSIRSKFELRASTSTMCTEEHKKLVEDTIMIQESYQKDLKKVVIKSAELDLITHKETFVHDYIDKVYRTLSAQAAMYTSNIKRSSIINEQIKNNIQKVTY